MILMSSILERIGKNVPLRNTTWSWKFSNLICNILYLGSFARDTDVRAVQSRCCNWRKDAAWAFQLNVQFQWSMANRSTVHQSTGTWWMVHQTLQFTAYAISIDFTRPSPGCGSLFVGSKSISQVFEQKCSFSLGDIKTGSFHYH